LLQQYYVSSTFIVGDQGLGNNNSASMTIIFTTS